MHNRRGNAGSRTVLAALCMLTVLVAQNPGFDCRPAWSPNGEQLLCECLVGGRPSIALYDRRTGRATLQFAPPGAVGFRTPLWRLDGNGAVIVCTGGDTKHTLMVTRLTIPAATASSRTCQEEHHSAWVIT